jgi:hypothetical protein
VTPETPIASMVTRWEIFDMQNLFISFAYVPFCGILNVKDVPNYTTKQQGGWLEACKETYEGCNIFEVGKRIGLVNAI